MHFCRYVYEVCKLSYKKLDDADISNYGFSSYLINYASKKMLINIPLDARNLQATGTKYVSSYENDKNNKKKLNEPLSLKLSDLSEDEMLKFLKDPYALLEEENVFENLSEKLSNIFLKIKNDKSSNLSALSILEEKLSSQRIKIDIFNCPNDVFPRFAKNDNSITLFLTNSISYTCVNEFQAILYLISCRLMFKNDIEDHDSIKRIMDFFFYSLGIKSELVLRTRRCKYSTQSIALSMKMML
uniref:Uncharacterized protein n=1 Tax=Strongyloides stercoralis TaxID=6248 RepID=A0AAF5DMG4_STRER